MTKTNAIKLFEDKLVRSVWDDEKEEWFFSVFDVVEILTDSKDPKQYIKKMRMRDEELNFNWGTICTPLQMIGRDGKRREIQSADTKGILRIIQYLTKIIPISVQGQRCFYRFLPPMRQERCHAVTERSEMFRLGDVS